MSEVATASGGGLLRTFTGAFMCSSLVAASKMAANRYSRQ